MFDAEDITLLLPLTMALIHKPFPVMVLFQPDDILDVPTPLVMVLHKPFRIELQLPPRILLQNPPPKKFSPPPMIQFVHPEAIVEHPLVL